MKKRTAKPRPLLVGWREWAGLPNLGVERIKAKIDTGARTSAMHAWRIEPFDDGGAPWVAFDLHPVQRDNRRIVTCRAPVEDRRRVKSSTGHAQTRYVIETTLALGGLTWPIELTLTRRDEMGFRLLIGRTALRRRALVDPARSYIALPKEGRS